MRGPALRHYQQQAVRGLLSGMRDRASQTLTVMFPRQAGKNEVSAVLIAELLREHAEEGGSLVVCAPTFHPQAAISFERARHILGASDSLLPDDGRMLAAVPTIAVGQARAVFLSASPEAHVAGHTASIGLIADEAQDIDADWFNRQFRPMAASTGAPTTMFGTPWTGETLLERAVAVNRLADAAKAGTPYRDFIPRHHEVRWETVAHFLPAYGRHVRAERERLGAGHPLFRTQYELEPAEGDGLLLSPAQVSALEGHHPRLRKPIAGERYAAGLDLAGEGANADTVVLTIARVVEHDRDLGPARCEVVNHIAWRSRPFAEVTDACLAAARAWSFETLCVDASGIGAPTASQLSSALRGRVQPVVFTAAEKSALGYDLLAAASTSRLALYSADGTPESNACRAELRQCRAEFRPGGQLRWAAPSGRHDDFVASLALCLRAANAIGAPRVARGRSKGASPT